MSQRHIGYAGVLETLKLERDRNGKGAGKGIGAAETTAQFDMWEGLGRGKAPQPLGMGKRLKLPRDAHTPGLRVSCRDVARLLPPRLADRLAGANCLGRRVPDFRCLPKNNFVGVEKIGMFFPVMHAPTSCLVCCSLACQLLQQQVDQQQHGMRIDVAVGNDPQSVLVRKALADIARGDPASAKAAQGGRMPGSRCPVKAMLAAKYLHCGPGPQFSESSDQHRRSKQTGLHDPGGSHDEVWGAHDPGGGRLRGRGRAGCEGAHDPGGGRLRPTRGGF